MHILFYALFAGLWPQYVYSHSWVERINLYSNGEVELSAFGYSRGNILRTDPKFHDALMTYQLPLEDGIEDRSYDTDRICAPSQQSQTKSGVTKLIASPGSIVVLQYNENGHITKPQNNAIGLEQAGTGQVFVYGTSDSQPTDTLLDIHKVWTSDGEGGNKRGRLLYQGTFDDAKCYQSSTDSAIQSEREQKFPPPGDVDPAQSTNLWCKNIVPLPTKVDSSVYTLYWVWDWPFLTPNGSLIKPQIYTTCIDIDMGIIVNPIAF